MDRKCFVCVDFDGTVVKHEFPATGEDIGAAPYLRAAVALGADLILWTMRSHRQQATGEEGRTVLEAAVDWFDGNQIELYSINENRQQAEWTDSLKTYANIYIDDAALGAFLKRDHKRGRPYIDWDLAGPALLKRVAGILNQ